MLPDTISSDLHAFAPEEGRFTLTDAAGERVQAAHRLIPRHVVRVGRQIGHLNDAEGYHT